MSVRRIFLFSVGMFFLSFLVTSSPNCDFALLVENARKASSYDCPVCHQPFCQRCSQVWHPNLTCDLASAQRAAQDPTLEMLMQSSANGGNIRSCPRCKQSLTMEFYCV